MRSIPIVFIAAMMFLGRAVQADESVAPRAACRALDMPAVLFDPGDADPTIEAVSLVEWTVRQARACRYSKIALTVFADTDAKSNRAMAAMRAGSVKQLLWRRGWPAENIELSYAPARAAPSGNDNGKAWTAGAILGFRDPDPDWQPPLENPLQTCSGLGQNHECKTVPWRAPRTFALPFPPTTYDPPSVFFGHNDFALNDEAKQVLPAALAIRQEGNYQRFTIVGFADSSEADAANLSFRRALAVRDELVRLGLPSEMISVEGHGAQIQFASPDGRDKWSNQRVQIDFGD
jgi:outer membrane protein OmpA-like peptidoglycan-associated protein